MFFEKSEFESSGVVSAPIENRSVDRNSISTVIGRYDLAIRRYLATRLGGTFDQPEIRELLEERLLGLEQPEDQIHLCNRLRIAVYRELEDILLATTPSQAATRNGNMRNHRDNRFIRVEQADDENSRTFAICWRQSLLKMAWSELEQAEESTGSPYYTVLRQRYAKSYLTVNRLLTEMVDEFETIPTKQGFREFLYRSRVRFANLVVQEVKRTLLSSDELTFRRELRELELEYHAEIVSSSKVMRQRFTLRR